MASTPGFKIYSPNKEYIAACKYAEDAAALAAILGDGTTIRFEHGAVLWTEGSESQSAGESYDYAAEVMHNRHSHQQSQPRRARKP